MKTNSLQVIVEKGFEEVRGEFRKLGERIDGVEATLGARMNKLENNFHRFGLKFEAFQSEFKVMIDAVTGVEEKLKQYIGDEPESLASRVAVLERRRTK